MERIFSSWSQSDTDTLLQGESGKRGERVGLVGCSDSLQIGRSKDFLHSSTDVGGSILCALVNRESC